MIERMTHYTFLVYHRDYAPLLQRLQTLGLLHVTPTRAVDPTENTEFQAALTQVQRLEQALGEMRALLHADEVASLPAANPSATADVAQIVVGWQQLCAQIEAERKTLADLERDIQQVTPWGDFSHDNLKRLADVGWKVRFWTVDPRRYEAEWEQAYTAVVINRTSRLTYFITVTPTAQGVPELAEATEVQLSPSPESTLIMLQTRAKDALTQLLIRQGDFAVAHYRELEQACRTRRGALDLRSVELTTASSAGGRVMLLEGWVPTARRAAFEAELSTMEGICWEARAAQREDNAPIKLRNGRFARMYEVLTRMYGMPDYGEFDPTPLIAPFFTLFFGFCMGDAGYGVLLVLLGFWLKRKMSKDMAGMMNLVITLGITTTVMGALLGTCFGVSLTDLKLPEWLKSCMIVGKIDGTTFDKQMVLALIIGVVHICIAMTVKAIGSTVRYGFKESLSAWGWLILVIGFLAAGGLSFFQLITPEAARWIFIIVGAVSSIGIFLFNNIRRNILINIGAGLWDTYSMATGLLSDVLSYIRLYALGLAGAMLGSVFNDLGFMARDAAMGGLGDATGAVVGWICCGLILVFGHALNIAMSCLSAFVHPLRLTFVEYFKNSGYDGRGEAYKPLSLDQTYNK